jgi:hypothetical protein
MKAILILALVCVALAADTKSLVAKRVGAQLKVEEEDAKNPAGVEYDWMAKAFDDDVIAPEGVYDPKEFLLSWTQYDESDKYNEDDNRCGPSVAIALAYLKGKEGLTSLLTYVKTTAAPKKKLTYNQKSTIGKVLGKLKKNTATYLDMSICAEIMLKTWGYKDAGTYVTHTDQLYDLITGGVGMTTTLGGTQPTLNSFTAGTGFAALMNNNAGGGHFVVFGKFADGLGFVYDPFPLSMHNQYYTSFEGGYYQYAAVNWLIRRT